MSDIEWRKAVDAGAGGGFGLVAMQRERGVIALPYPQV